MKFSLESGSGVNLIRSYSAEEIRIADSTVRTSCLVTSDQLITDWQPRSLDELTLDSLQPLFALQPELVLLGTGPIQRFPPAAIRRAFDERGIGLEAMSLGAACRTFNVLIQEERRVAAALFLR